MNFEQRSKVLVTGGSGFIGVHVAEELINRGYNVLNLDISAPIDGTHNKNWKDVSILDTTSLTREFENFEPTYVIHLAAVTAQDAKSLTDFEVNITGTRNVLRLCKETPSVSKVIFTSTQYVNRAGIKLPDELIDYEPFGLYGQSKLQNEKDIHSEMNFDNWIIVRPTAIWGKWHPILTKGLWMQILKGRYLHPSGDQAVKPYGFVRNTAWQYAQLLELPNAVTDRKTFYLADKVQGQSNWVRMFIEAFGCKYREVPKTLLFLISKIGDLAKSVGFPFPLYKSRYQNMMQTNPIDLTETIDLLGKSPIFDSVGVEEVARWIMEPRDQGS